MHFANKKIDIIQFKTIQRKIFYNIIDVKRRFYNSYRKKLYRV